MDLSIDEQKSTTTVSEEPKHVCWKEPSDPCGSCFGCWLDYLRDDPVYSVSREGQGNH